MPYVHTPVLLAEVLELLSPQKANAVLVDANLGEGGHAEAFLRAFPSLILLGVDVDREVTEVAAERLASFAPRVRIFQKWSEEFFLNYDSYYSEKPDRILFDLGISAFHYEKGGRGFSFRKDEPLDMRLHTDLDRSAQDIVNGCSEEELSQIFFRYGEERFARRIASSIVRARMQQPIVSSLRLAEIVALAVPGRYRHGRIHPATRCFQALRLAVNRELEELKGALEGAFRVLKREGRIGVISFHSLEDRIVKHFFREKNKTCTCPPAWPICKCGGQRELKILTGKPIRPKSEEESRNPASRSARLRVVEKLV
ncbi:MAG TPA: 16S rRNA (cytosine(1402)-N(4))-methyltransferase RsmH [Spirochaetia bacterium]|nr:16S rRNA (cytosine(1402)-N(4))-methyltransferase RsmH [Spirochaetia bacterium]